MRRTPLRSGSRLSGAGLAALLGLTLAACSAPSQQEYDAAVAEFEALPDDVKAYVCADDWYAVQFGVEGFVLVEQCGPGSGAEVVDSQPLSSAFEEAEQDYARQYYAENPPQPRQLRDVDAERLCAQDESELRAEIEQWRQQTTFPSWQGVEYVPSVDHELAKLEIWRDVACPLLG